MDQITFWRKRLILQGTENKHFRWKMYQSHNLGKRRYLKPNQTSKSRHKPGHFLLLSIFISASKTSYFYQSNETKESIGWELSVICTLTYKPLEFFKLDEAWICINDFMNFGYGDFLSDFCLLCTYSCMGWSQIDQVDISLQKMQMVSYQSIWLSET